LEGQVTGAESADAGDFHDELPASLRHGQVHLARSSAVIGDVDHPAVIGAAVRSGSRVYSPVAAVPAVSTRARWAYADLGAVDLHLDQRTVQGLMLVGVGHIDQRDTEQLPGGFVAQQDDASNRANGLERPSNICFGRRARQIADVKNHNVTSLEVGSQLTLMF